MSISITGAQVRAARGLLDISQVELAALAKVSLPTIKRLEKSDQARRVRADTLKAVARALERKGAVLIAANGGGPGVRLRRPNRQTRRRR